MIMATKLLLFARKMMSMDMKTCMFSKRENNIKLENAMELGRIKGDFDMGLMNLGLTKRLAIPHLINMGL